jgi:excisionase family DNA binding protein
MSAADALVLHLPALEEIRASLARIERQQALLASQLADVEAAQAHHVDVEEAARRLEVSRATAWRMIKRNELAATRIGGRTRIAVADLRRASEERVAALAAGARR